MQEHTGVTAVEKNIQPKVVKQAEILDGVGIEPRPLCTVTCAINRGRRRTPFSRPIAKTRYWRAGSTAWAAPSFSHRTPRIAGPRTGLHGLASTSFGRTFSAIFCRMRRRAKRRPISIARRTSGRGLSFIAERGRPGGDPRYLRGGPNGFQAPLKVDQGNRRPLSRQARNRTGAGLVPRASGRRFARVSRSRLLSPGRRNAGIRQQ